MAINVPWAIEDLIIGDGENWRSRLVDGLGLAAANPALAGRFGRRPVLAGVDLPRVEQTLETLWLTDVHATRRTWRGLLKRMLDPARRTARRLVVADVVLPGAAPSGVVLALGPWDVYSDVGTWKARDVLVSSLEATLSGGWDARPEGLVLLPAGTNLVTNPSVETNLTNWVAIAGATVTRDATETRCVGEYAGKIVCAAAADGVYINSTNRMAVTAGLSYNVAAYTRVETSPTEIRITIDWYDAGGAVVSSSSTTNLLTNLDWLWVTLLVATAPGGAVTAQVAITLVTAAARVFWLDGVKFQEGVFAAYSEPYFDGDTPGAAWSGTAHGSSSRVASGGTLAVANPLSMAAGSLLMWWTPTADERGLTRYLFDEGNLTAYFDATDDKIYFTDGTNTISTAALNWSPGDTLYLAFVWGSGLKVYLDGAIAATGATYTAPTAGATLYVGSDTAGANQCTGALHQVRGLNYALSAAQVATWYAAGDANPRWRDVLCRAADPFMVKSAPSDKGLVASLVVDGDERWRQRDVGADWWRYVMRGDSLTLRVTNAGEDAAYPVLYLTPRVAKSTGYAYKRFVAVRWRASTGYTRYPVDICNAGFDTATLVAAGKMQADGDDLRVFVNGLEVDRWLDGIDTATTKVWCNLTFAPDVTLTLKTAIAGAGDVTTIEVNEAIGAMPTAGILVIDSEVFTYTSRNVTDRRFLGVTRAAKGTSAAAHLAAATASWLQHDVFIVYGNAAAAAPSVDGNYAPAFELDHSTNTSWVYEEFGEDDGLRAGQWYQQSGSFAPTYYGGDRGASADPWVELGINANFEAMGMLLLLNPCEITNLNFTNGEKWAANKTYYTAQIVSLVGSTPNEEYLIPAPSANSTWESWSRSEAITSGRTVAGLALTAGIFQCYVEAADCTVSLNASYTPTVSIGSEQGNYELALTVENGATGEALTLTLSMELDEVAILDTDGKTLVYQGQNQMQALELAGGAWLDWLRLEPGENPLTFTDTGTLGLEIELVFDRRLYE